MILWVKTAYDFVKSLNPTTVIVGLLICVALAGVSFVQGASWEKDRLEAQAAKARAKEISRQDAANEAAKVKATTAIDALNRQIDDLNTKLEENANDAQKDPAAASCGVSADGMRRLDRVR